MTSGSWSYGLKRAMSCSSFAVRRNGSRELFLLQGGTRTRVPSDLTGPFGHRKRLRLAFARLDTADLAGRRLRQLVDELDLARIGVLPDRWRACALISSTRSSLGD
jgi:hypothetical protein